MLILRIGGFICSMLWLWYIVSRRLRGELRRFDLLAGLLVAFALLVLAVYPQSLDFIFNLIAAEGIANRRLFAVIIGSIMLLYFLVFHLVVRMNQERSALDQLVRRLTLAPLRDLPPLTEPAIAVVIPAYHEEGNIGAVLASMPASVQGRAVKVIVVDDGSYDGTEAIVRRHGGYFLRNVVNRGGGTALQMGYACAYHLGIDVIATMDADGQHLPEELPQVVAPVLAGEADVVIGSRRRGREEKVNAARTLGVTLFGWFISVITGRRITDPSSNYRAFRADALQRLQLYQAQFHTSELIIDAAAKGLRLVEVPITIRRRLSGETKKPRSLQYGWGFLKAVLKTWLR